MKKIVLVLVVSLVIVGPACAGPVDWLMEIVGYSPTAQIISARAAIVVLETKITMLEETIVFLTRINWIGVGLVLLLIITGEVLRRWVCGVFYKMFKKTPLLDPTVKTAFETFQNAALEAEKAKRAAKVKP